MSKQYMTIEFGGRTATVRTNSEKAIKNALGKLRIYGYGTVVSFVIKGNIIKYSLRAGRKDGSDDAGKARHYMLKLKEVQDGTNA